MIKWGEALTEILNEQFYTRLKEIDLLKQI